MLYENEKEDNNMSVQEILIFSTSVEIEETVRAYAELIKGREDIGIGVVDFSKLMGKRENEEKNREALKSIEEECKIPTYLFGSDQQKDFFQYIKQCVKTRDDAQVIDDLTFKGLDYGAMRNKGFILAKLTGAKIIHYFDADTRPHPGHKDILDKHKKLLNDEVVAVSGEYDGPLPVDTTMFETDGEKERFLKVVKDYTGVDPREQKIIGGVFSLTSFYEKCALPNLRRTSLTDDAIIAKIAEICRKKTERSYCRVLHLHERRFDIRKGRRQIKDYLYRFARAASVECFITDPGVRDTINDIILSRSPDAKDKIKITIERRLGRLEAEAIEKVQNYSEDLQDITGIELIQEVGKQIYNDARNIADEVRDGIERYLEFLYTWPEIMDCAGEYGKNAYR